MDRVAHIYAWIYVCMKWDVPNVIRILKELLVRYIIESANYGAYRHFHIRITIFLYLCLSYRISFSSLPINPHNSNDQTVNQRSLSAHARMIDQDVSTRWRGDAVTRWRWNYLRKDSREDRFGEWRTEFLLGCTSNAGLYRVLVLTVCFRIQSATVVFTGASNVVV